MEGDRAVVWKAVGGGGPMDRIGLLMIVSDAELLHKHLYQIILSYIPYKCIYQWSKTKYQSQKQVAISSLQTID